ncbi:MAG TPA: iron-containing redox enzyme family protein [Polyangiaceae bacterium]|nr:iron-containing redox enzyme family protein [Polyangiaceae bacterium]
MTERVVDGLPAAEEIVRRYEKDSLADHPYFQRLRREPVDTERLWRLIVNGREGVVLDFPRRLASIIARTKDERIRSMLAKQLNDELGNGDYSRAHRLLFERMLAAVDPWRPAATDERTLAPGSALSARLEAVYSDPEPYVGVGGAMVIEISSKQIDISLGDEIRRHGGLAPKAIEWLSIHEELELVHAEESMTMAHLIPESGAALAATWRGAEAVGDGLWDFFDALHGAKTERPTMSVFHSHM